MTDARGAHARSPRRRWVLVPVVALAVVVASWLVWCVVVIQHPQVDQPRRVDAVLVLGGLDGPQRTERALGFVRAGRTDTLVLSVPSSSADPLAHRLCASPPSGVDVICFAPDPSTTRGEARELRTLARERGWTSAAVITSTYHVSRARAIVERCFSGRLDMVTSDEPIGVRTWTFQYIYQSAGWAKVLFQSGC